MATSTGAHVTSGNAWNKQQPSCLGFAGKGSGHATMIQVDFDWWLDWSDLDHIKLTLSDWHFQCYQDGGLISGTYPFYINVDLSGPKTMPLNVVYSGLWTHTWSVTVGDGDKTKRWNLDYHPGGSYTIDLGSIDNQNFNNGDMVVWIGGCSYNYEVDDPVYPSSIPIYLHAEPDLDEQIDYFPWAIRSNDTWRSLNRAGGRLSIYDGSQWRDIKNAAKGTKANGLSYNGTSWAKSPLIGGY